MIGLKSDRELVLMKRAGRITADVLFEISKKIKPGVKTVELDRFSEKLINDLGGRPAFKGYRGYPASICVSINEVIVHGIPGERTLENGDIVSIDVGVEVEGYNADSAMTYAVGKVDTNSLKLIEVTRESLARGIDKVRAGNKVSLISAAIQNYVEVNGFNVIRVFIGHGIGSELHEDPEIPNFVDDNLISSGRDPVLKSGMVLAIEPMVSCGKYDAEILDDGWTAVTRDRSRVAHFEHTIAVTNKGPEILTLCQKKKQ